MEFLENVTFDELSVGQSSTIEKVLTRQDIQEFALVTGDINPTHLDEDYAESEFFHEVIGHGMWSGALISMVLGTRLPGPGTIYLHQDLRFLKPVKLGDVITVTLTVLEKINKHNQVVFDCKCVNQDHKTVTEGKASVIAPLKKFKRAVTHLPKLTLIDPGAGCRKIIEQAHQLKLKTKLVVAHPCSEYALQGALEAAQSALVKPILVGPMKRIRKLAEQLDSDLSAVECIDVPHSHAAAQKAVELIHAGKADVLMKGSLHTDELMQAVLNKSSGLLTGRRISHCFVMDVPSYDRPLIITDGAINIRPNLDEKHDIVQHAIDLAKALEVPVPKVALLAAVETVNAKMPCTLDAAALCKMAERGQIKGGLLDGPLAFDNAISQQAASIKGIHSQVSGQADIMMVPDLVSGNLLAKQLSYLSQAKGAGIVLGAKVPIVLTSRADDSLTRITSCALAILYSHHQKQRLAEKS